MSERSLGTGPLDDAAIRGVVSAVRQAADVICDRWTLLVLLGIASGAVRFGELQDATAASSRVLSSRLRTLERQAVVCRVPYSSRPDRFEHRLDVAGHALLPVFATFATWERQACGSVAPAMSLVHHSCGALDPAAVATCSACGSALSPGDVDVIADPRRLAPLADKARSYRRSGSGRDTEVIGDRSVVPFPVATLIFGDKWTTEVVLAAFLRVRTFGEFQRHLGISSNILTDRLGILVRAGVLARVDARVVTPRGGYLLTLLGRGLFPALLALEQWADASVRDRRRSPLALLHRPCGAAVELCLRCSTCDGVIGSGSVGFSRTA